VWTPETSSSLGWSLTVLGPTTPSVPSTVASDKVLLHLGLSFLTYQTLNS
jgi:hypothetical protein